MQQAESWRPHQMWLKSNCYIMEQFGIVHNTMQEMVYYTTHILLLFGSGYFIFSFLIQKYKDLQYSEL